MGFLALGEVPPEDGRERAQQKADRRGQPSETDIRSRFRDIFFPAGTIPTSFRNVAGVLIE
jgi:hypothetical protein